LRPANHSLDAELVSQTLAGDLAAFEALARRYRGLAFAVAYQQLGRFDDAEDAAQEALVEAYRKLPLLRDPSRFGAWLRRIAAGKAAEAARRRREEPLAPEEIEMARGADPPAPTTLEMTVWAALAGLSPAVRLATTLFYVDGLAYAEIAAHLEVPASTVRGRLQRARAFLREELLEVVTAGLRGARPDERFVERVMSRVQSIKVIEQRSEQGDIEHPLLHLVDEQGRRLSIYIGASEAFHIDFQLQGKQADRPLTYPFFATILAGFGLKVTRAEVAELKDNTFFALLTVEGNSQVKSFDCRPSDAIPLALAAGAEIYVNDQVLDIAAVSEEPGPTLPPEIAERLQERSQKLAGG
jgi:RNA polymerase sigma-70 factor (ECF subfamily)